MANTPKTATKKPKLVRDSFTIPKAEYAVIDEMKARAITLGQSVKKSELLRAGLQLLKNLDDHTFKAAISAVPTLKTGRPAAEAPVTEAPKTVKKTATKTADPTTAASKAAGAQADKPAKKPAAAATPAPAASVAAGTVRRTARKGATPADSPTAATAAPSQA